MNSCGNPAARWRRVQRAGRMSGPFVRFAPNAVECGDTAAVASQTVPHSSLQGPMASAAVSDEGALRMRLTPCGCTSALLSEFTGTAVDAATPQLCLRRLVLTNSTSLAPPQAAGLVRSVARPLQIANASLVCNLVPSVLPEKVGKKRRWRRVILRADVRDFWPLRGRNALFGRRIATVPIAFGSGKGTTRSYR